MKEMECMTWTEVRQIYPDQFVKFEIIESHAIDNKEYVDEVAVIKAVRDGKEAMKEFVHRNEGQFVYSTKNEEVVIGLEKHVWIRMSM
jgi:hypothetical protein